MSPLEYIALALATWRVAYLLVKEEGPFHLLGRFRKWTTLGGLLDCIYCMSLWAAIMVYVVWLIFQPAVWIAALSGGAMMFWRWTGGEHV